MLPVRFNEPGQELETSPDERASALIYSPEQTVAGGVFATEMLLRKVDVRSAGLSSAIVYLELSKQSCLVGKHDESAPESGLLGGPHLNLPQIFWCPRSRFLETRDRPAVFYAPAGPERFDLHFSDPSNRVLPETGSSKSGNREGQRF